MAIIPTGHHVLVEPEDLEKVDPAFAAAQRAGIQIPKEFTTKERVAVSRGKVLSMGPTAYQDFKSEPWCKVGDIVVYVRHGGMYVQDPDTKKDYLILNDEDIIAVLKGA